MARLVGPVFLDTSTLVAGLVDFQGTDTAPHRLLDRIAEGHLSAPSTAWHCCLEVYAVITRLPRELKLESKEAAQLVEREILDRFAIHGLPKRAFRRLLPEAANERVAGGRVYDFHIAAVARASGATIVVTENLRHFASLRLAGTSVMNAEEALAAA